MDRAETYLELVGGFLSMPAEVIEEARQKLVCSDCGGNLGQDNGPPDGWELEDGRIVCQACCVKDTKQLMDSYRELICRGT